MKYDKDYKKVHGTSRFKHVQVKYNDIKSFNISGEKYEDKRRIINRKFII